MKDYSAREIAGAAGSISESSTFATPGAEEPPPYRIYNPDGPAPVLLVADHASSHIPASLNQLGLEDWVMDRHVTWDIGSDRVAQHVSDLLGAPLVLAGFSRLVIDPNRRFDDPSAFPEISDKIPIPGNQGLSEEQKMWRASNFSRRYHQAISERLLAFRQSGQVPAFVSIHTCAPVMDRISRPWQFGVMWDKDPRIAVPLIERLRQAGDICVGDNEPYSGRHPYDFTIDHHAESAGLPHVAIEVRQDLVGNEQGARKWAEILAAGLRDILADEKLYQRWDQV